MSERFVLPIACVVALVLQVVVAPVLPLGSAVPSFLLPLVVVLAILRNPDSCYGYAFVIGLLADFLMSTPVGLSSLLLLIAAALLGSLFEVLDKSSFVMPAIAIAVTCFAIELLKLVALLLLGYQGSPLDFFLQSCLPAVVADSVIGAVYYFVFTKLGLGQSTSGDAWSTKTGTVGNQRFH